MINPIVKERRERANRKVLIIFGAIIYLLILIVLLHSAAIMSDNPRIGMMESIEAGFNEIFTNPLHMKFTKTIMMFIFMGTLLGGALMAASIAEKKMYKDAGTDMGDAHLMNLKEYEQYVKKYISPLGSKETNGVNNMILSKDIKLAIDNAGTRRNCNILAIGGSGAGKTRFFAGPNILQLNTNFVITDPSGEMLRSYGKILEDNGYKVKVFNIVDVYRSNRYNPFHYIKTEKDAFTMINTLIKNTNGDKKGAGDPFWENSERLLITALVLFLWHTVPEEKQTFANVLALLNQAKVDENDASAQSPLDLLFEDLEREDPKNLAVLQYKKFKMAAGNTLKSILISVGVRLQSFELDDMQYLTDSDDFEFETFADTKQAIFVIIPTADKTFNFIVSLLYSQLFASLYEYSETRSMYGWQAKIDNYTNVKLVQAKDKNDSARAEKEINQFIADVKEGVKIKYDKEKRLYNVYTKKGELVGWRGTEEKVKAFVKSLDQIHAVPCSKNANKGASCPNHVRMILDEFANIGQIPEFNEKLATIRKYEISCAIILQAISQLKEIYKDQWNTIAANCDTKILLGCDDSETLKWILEKSGNKTTLVHNTSIQSGKNGGSTSINKQKMELMTIDQLSMMQDNECLVCIRGVRPYFGKKYEITNHPNYAYAQSTADTFYIPINGNISMEEIRNSKKPLYVRKQKKPSSETASTTDTKLSKEFAQSKMRAENEVRKEEAAKARERAKTSVDQSDKAIQDRIATDLFKSMGLKPNATDAQIKEAIESCIIIENPETTTYVYTAN